MIRRLIILLLIVGCGIFEDEETNICVDDGMGHTTYFCWEWTDSENLCTINGHRFLTDTTCEDYCNDMYSTNDVRDCLNCSNSNPDCP